MCKGGYIHIERIFKYLFREKKRNLLDQFKQTWERYNAVYQTFDTVKVLEAKQETKRGKINTLNDVKRNISQVKRQRKEYENKKGSISNTTIYTLVIVPWSYKF